jgi:hypothetical protein
VLATALSIHLLKTGEGLLHACISSKNDAFNLYHPWHVFKMAELTQIMRQKDDLAFTQLLNRGCTTSHTDYDIRCIQSRTITPDDENYPSDALHIFAENAPVDEYNIDRLKQFNHHSTF